MLSDGEKVAVVAGCHTTERHKRQHSQDCATARIGFTNCACGKRSASSCWGRETRLERGKYQINGPIQLRQAAARIEVEGRRACERARDEQACERARERERDRERDRERVPPSFPPSLSHKNTHSQLTVSHDKHTPTQLQNGCLWTQAATVRSRWPNSRARVVRRNRSVLVPRA